jgi:DNA-binding beta-propeller fold protein YncE
MRKRIIKAYVQCEFVEIKSKITSNGHMFIFAMIPLALISMLVVPQNIMIAGEVIPELKNDGILYNPANENIYVIHDWMRSLTAINSSNAVEGIFFVGEEPIYLAYNPKINIYM